LKNHDLIGRKIIFLLFLLLGFYASFSGPLPAFSQEQPVWVEEVGRASLGDNDTLAEVRERARKEAGARALEKAKGTFIKAHTLVSNSQLVEDLIFAAVRGHIEKLEVLDEGWESKEKNIYQVKIKALIRPVYPEKEGGLLIKPALSKSDLQEGEAVKIFYQVNRNCYVYIFSIAADGSVTLLFPNSINSQNFITSGNVYEFPEPGSRIQLQARFLPNDPKNVAEERIKIIATQEKEDLIPLGFREGMFKIYDAKSTGLISDLVKRLNRLDPASWTEATLTYRLRR
jgi:hypothetical protein